MINLEHKSKRVAPVRVFALRFFVLFLCTMGLTGLSLLAGIWGYEHYEGMSLTDAFLNAAMILGGMGEIDPLKTEGGKIFAGFYALYSGLVVIASMGLLLTPFFHRMLHKFHAEKD